MNDPNMPQQTQQPQNGQLSVTSQQQPQQSVPSVAEQNERLKKLGEVWWANKAKQIPPKTADYTSHTHIYWQQPRDLPPFSFFTIYNMLVDPEVRLALTIRCAPLFGAEWGYKNPDGSWQSGIQCRRPEVGAYVQRQLERIWRNHLPDLCQSQTWGWSAGEVTLKLGESNLIEVNRLESRRATDCLLLLNRGIPAGCRVRNVKNHPDIDLAFPSAFFHNHNPEPGGHYGVSALLGAYSPWADKWLDGGGLDVRRLFMHKDAYGGTDLGYPDGSSFIDASNEPIPNRDVARQIVQQIRSGNVITRPSERDANGNEKWPLTRATIPANPQHILQYPKDLDSEIRAGIGIPEQIIEASGSWAGARIPMAAFYASLDAWLVQMLNDLTEQVFEPLVLLNWGKAEDFQIGFKPLAEQAMEQQSNAGPGQPGQQQPGDPNMMAGGDGMDGLMGMMQGQPGQDQMQDQPFQMSLVRSVGRGVLSAAELVKAANHVIRLSAKPNPQEPARLIAEILTHIYGDEAESHFDEMFGSAAVKMATWSAIDHPRGKAGRFIEKNSPEAVAAAKDQIKKALTGRRTPTSLKAVTENLSILTTKQLEEVKREYGIKVAGPVKQSLIDKIASRLQGATVEADETGDDDFESSPEQENGRDNGTPGNPSNTDVYTVPTDSLHVDPSRFQYKVSGIDSKTGTTKELKSVGVWNPELGGVLLVWRDPESGDDFVVNGHHRHELASRLGAEEINVRYIDAPTAIEARARGALSNIAEGRGTAVDAAKYLRDVGADVDHLKRAGVSLSNRVAADATILTGLADEPFQRLTEGMIDEQTAVAVARHLKDPKLQTQLFKRIDEKDWSNREIETAAKKMANAGKHTESGSDLFGDFESQESTFDQEVEIESYISRMLSMKANDYRAVANQRRADRVADAGNILAIDENTKRQSDAETMADRFGTESGLKGPIADLVKEFAAQLAVAKTRTDRNEVKELALDAIETELAGGSGRTVSMSIIRMDLTPGATKQKDGKTYVLNDNHRWTNPDAPSAVTDHEHYSAQLRSVKRARTPTGFVGKLDFDARMNQRNYQFRVKHPVSGWQEFPERFKHSHEAAQYGANRMLELFKQYHPESETQQPKPDNALPSNETPAKTRKPVKTKSEVGNWHYKNRDFFSRGAKAKFRDNVNAIKTMQTLKLEEREPTKDEQETISKYVGWGQFPQLFTYRHGTDWHAWEKEREELESLVGNDEYESARRSTTNSHYTHPDVVAAHWEMAQRLGFNGGRYLEPAVGSGYYLGLMPEALAEKTSTTAIEMDELTGGIAKQLYPDSKVSITPFQKHPTPDNFYDLVATNVPFDGRVRITDPKYKSMRPTLHDYYFLRSVDTAKPGGLIMHITSAGTMDKLDSRVRDYINKNCELVSAIRFPSDAHKDNAGTEVVTDMLILRKKHPDIPETTDETPKDAEPKQPGFTGITRDSLGRLYHWRDGKRVPGPDWSSTVDVPDPNGGDPIRINKYFADNPEQMLGTLDRSGTMYSGGMKNVRKTDDYDQRLESAIARLPQDILWADKSKPAAVEAKPAERIEADQKYNEGQLVIKDGKIFQHDGGALEAISANASDQTRIVGMIGVRDKARNLLRVQQAGGDGETELAELNEAYDSFVKEHGPLSDKMNRRAMRSDPDSTFLLSLEYYNGTTKTAEKADIFSKNTVRREVRATSAGSVAEATGIVLHETGRMDIGRIAELTGKSVDEIGDELVSKGLAYNDPSRGWTSAAEYLSGNTRKKLLEARTAAAADPQYEANVAALEKSQPEDIDAEDIGVKLGAPWVPPSIIAQFSAEVLGASEADFKIRYTEATGEWSADLVNTYVGNRKSNTDVWGVRDDDGNLKVDYMDCLDAALSGRAITVRSAQANENGGHDVLPEQTEAARQKVEELKSQFKDWVWTDPERAELLHRHYNDNYNNIVPMHYDGSHLTFPGMKEGFTPRQIQKDFVWRVITTGKGLAAHEVGTGKTASMIASAMELRRLGLAKKPAIAVLKSNIEQITAEAQELYPGAKILSTGDMFTPEKRQQTLNRIATGDYDMIVLTHDHLDAMRMKPETTAKFIREELDELAESILAAEADNEGERGAGKKSGNRIVKKLESQKMKLEQQLQEALNEETKDSIFFEDTGIDQLFVDEAHNFKSLPCHSRRGEIKGIPSQRSQRATTMLARTRWLLGRHNGRGVVFATGTPIANTMGELFNMQRYLQFDSLQERGVHRFDAWADTYGDTVNRIEFKLDGDVKPTTRFAEFVNLPELRHLASDFMDVQRADNMVKADGTPAIIRPKRHDQIVLSPSNDGIAGMMAEIHSRAAALKGKRRGEKGEDNMLSVCNDAKLGSIDMRLIDPDAEDHPDSKANQAVRKIVELYHEHPGTTQAVFSDLGVHENKHGFSVFADMKRKLIAAGIPAEHIADFSDEKMKDAKREETQEAMKRADVRIAFGSTKRLGTGTNIQKKLRAIHHLDIPYVPAYLEQRDGRGYRSGNQNKDLDIYKYVQEDSADNLFWQIVANKSHFINQYMLGKGNRSMQDLDTETLTPDEMMAVATGDSTLVERVTLEDEVGKLRRAVTRHAGDQQRMRETLESADEKRAELKAKRDAHAQDLKHVESMPDFSLRITQGTKSYHSERADAEPALAEAIGSAQKELSEMPSWKRPDSIQIGRYRSMAVHVKANGFLELEGPSGQRYESGGSLKSLEYAARSIAKKKEKADLDINNFAADLSKMKEAVKQPFRHGDVLKEKEARLAELKNKKRE